MKSTVPALMLLAVSALLLAACGGGGAKPALPSTPTTGATATPTPTLAPTHTPAPPPPETPDVAPAQSVGGTPFGVCLEERIGPKAARALISGERVETPEEEAVLEDCLLAGASGVSAQAISSAVATCLEEGLGAGVLQAVGSGARGLTAQEESILVDCLLASTLDAASEEILPAVTACLGDKIGTEAAQAIASGSRQLTADEEAVLGDCVLASALGATTSTVSSAVAACLEDRLATEAAQAIASGSRQLTVDEQTALGDCVLGSAFAATTGKVSPPVTVCLEDRLGTEAAQAIASGSRQGTANEQTVLGDCVLASAFGATTGTASPPVAACLGKHLGAEAAQAAASGSRKLTAQESSVLGGCLLEAALGAKP